MTVNHADPEPQDGDNGTRRDRMAQALIRQLLQVVDEGVGPLTGAREYAQSREKILGNPEAAIRRIVRETMAQAGMAGFVTGLGGFITLPIALPANIAGQAVLNARMVAAIAHLRGWDLNDEVVRHSILLVVAGESPNQVLRQFGVRLGQQLTATAIKRIPMAAIWAINKKAGFMLLAKYGTKRSLVTLAKGIPVAGAAIGSAVDATFTRTVASLAKRSFSPVFDSPGDQR
jgi:hypothetical protein